jgi:hypothetical protein
MLLLKKDGHPPPIPRILLPRPKICQCYLMPLYHMSFHQMQTLMPLSKCWSVFKILLNLLSCLFYVISFLSGKFPFWCSVSFILLPMHFSQGSFLFDAVFLLFCCQCAFPFYKGSLYRGFRWLDLIYYWILNPKWMFMVHYLKIWFPIQIIAITSDN